MKCKYYKPYMDTLKALTSEYYHLDKGSCCCGGPLHITLDDDNYDIGSVRFCMQHCFDGLTGMDPTLGYSKDVYILGIMICNEYAKMSLEERAVFDAYMYGERLDCCGNCEECDLLGELYEFCKEKEENWYRRMEERK